MLGKLLKYEMKGTGRTLLPFYGLMITLAAITRLFNGINIYEFSKLGQIAMGIVAFSYGLTATSVMMLTAFLVVQRFYKTVYGDEGYLTHTLPVKSRDIIISKTISSFVWVALSALIAGISVIIIAYQAGMWNDILYALNYWTEGIVFGKIIITGVNLMLLSIFSIISMTLMVYMSISIGQLFKRKLIGSLGAFIGVSFIVNTVTGIIGNSRIAEKFINISGQNSAQAISDFNVLVWILIAFYIIKIVIYYFVTEHMMTKKLNLE
ncbi:hypothetical protein [Proteocatella sphenisci]|uniref:hypothetical protein n=1 Tax=Proteocatella sphenisci TaxID=181070 RepID=UPI00048AAA56|nr:hypothetical protein [Proteocatella sphenisci]